MDLPPTFNCTRQAMTLTPLGCSKFWRAANEGPRRPEPWESKARCVGCPVGAAHSGVSASQLAVQAAVEGLRSVCARCLRTAERGDRRRALVHDRFCASCDMRDREASRGRNAKGNPPALMKLLHGEAIAAIRIDLPGSRPVVHAFARVACRMEAAVLAARASRGPVALCRPPFALPGMDANLWGRGLPIVFRRRPARAPGRTPLPCRWHQAELAL